MRVVHGDDALAHAAAGDSNNRRRCDLDMPVPDDSGLRLPRNGNALAALQSADFRLIEVRPHAHAVQVRDGQQILRPALGTKSYCEKGME